MEIRWLGHSCFKVTHAGYSVVLDPYKPDMVPGLRELHVSANEVLCSHEHEDHNYRKAVTIEKTKAPSPFTIERIPSFHDAVNGSRRGQSLITVLSAGGMRVAHLGDQGCLLNPKQVARLLNLDALMIPVGGFFTIGPKEAAEIVGLLQPKVVIPMHYRGRDFGFPALEKAEAFTKLLRERKTISYPIDTLVLENIKEPQTAVLKYL